MTATTPRGLLEWARMHTGARRNAFPAPEVVAGDASNRRYFRLRLPDRNVILVHAPPATEKNAAFVQVARLLARAGVRVPRVLAYDLERGYLLLEDLGDDLLLPALNELTVDQHYTSASKILVRLATLELGVEELPRYDAALLREELARFPDWFVGGLLDYQPTPPEVALWNRVATRLVESALAQPYVTVHRDFHSRNLMRLGEGALGVIDFQDAVLGPITYDLVSLLRDCYIRWPADRVRGWALRHRDELVECGRLPGTGDAQFLEWFDLMGLQRHIKVLGNFSRLSVRDRRHDYLADLPMVLGYILEVLDDRAETDRDLAAFADWMREVLLPRARAQDWGATL